MRNQFNILVIDDEEKILDALRLNLEQTGYSVATAKTGEEGLVLFNNGDYDLVLADLQLPDMQGTEVMRRLKEKRPSIEVIIISGYGSVARAVEATKAGAFHFVEKPFEIDALLLLIERALERQLLIEESDVLRRTLQQRSTYGDIVGRSKQMQNIFEMIEAVAKSDANILIVGRVGHGQGADRERHPLQLSPREGVVRKGQLRGAA